MVVLARVRVRGGGAVGPGRGGTAGEWAHRARPSGSPLNIPVRSAGMSPHVKGSVSGRSAGRVIEKALQQDKHR